LTPARALLIAILAGTSPELALLGQGGALNGVVLLDGADVTLASPDEPGRPAFLPAFGSHPLRLPEDLSSYRRLGENCDRRGDRALPSPLALAEGLRVLGVAEGDLDQDGQPETVILSGPHPEPGALLPYVPMTVTVHVRGAPPRSRVLDVTAFACELALQDVTHDGRADILVTWRSAGGSGFTQGISILGL
jgi:hypothetical protein